MELRRIEIEMVGVIMGAEGGGAEAGGGGGIENGMTEEWISGTGGVEGGVEGEVAGGVGVLRFAGTGILRKVA